MFPGKSFFSAHEVSTCKISGCLSYRILDSGPDGTQTTLTLKAVYGSNKTVPVEYKNATVITLQPLETLVFEAVPVN
ncbi:TPA: hypothetical protein IBZ76_000900 [Escherichia coli]|nr:hypothetical protein [Escherichia coli]